MVFSLGVGWRRTTRRRDTIRPGYRRGHEGIARESSGFDVDCEVFARDGPMASGPTASPAARYRFGDVEVDVAAHSLLRGGEPQPLEPKAFAVLLVLLRHPGALVGRDELLDAVWGHRHVTPGVLTRAIAQLRTALGDDPHRPRYIRTQHAVGYAFIGHLAPEATGAPSDATASDPGAPPPRPA